MANLKHVVIREGQAKQTQKGENAEMRYTVAHSHAAGHTHRHTQKQSSSTHTRPHTHTHTHTHTHMLCLSHSPLFSWGFFFLTPVSINALTVSVTLPALASLSVREGERRETNKDTHTHRHTQTHTDTHTQTHRGRQSG